MRQKFVAINQQAAWGGRGLGPGGVKQGPKAACGYRLPQVAAA